MRQECSPIKENEEKMSYLGADMSANDNHVTEL